MQSFTRRTTFLGGYDQQSAVARLGPSASLQPFVKKACATGRAASGRAGFGPAVTRAQLLEACFAADGRMVTLSQARSATCKGMPK